MWILCTILIRVPAVLADFYVEYLGCCSPADTHYVVLMLWLKMRENLAVSSAWDWAAAHGIGFGQTYDCWNMDLSVMANPQLYFLSKAALRAVHTVTTIILWSKRSHWSTVEFTGPQTSAEVSNELKQPFQHLLFLVMVPVEELGTASWSSQGNSLFT